MTDAPKRKLIRANLDYDPNHIHIDSFRASDIVMCTEGSTIIGATEDGPTVRVPWTQSNMVALSSNGLPHAPTMVNVHGEVKYPFAGFDSPFPYQYRITGFLTSHRRGFCLADPGTGKTACATWASDYLLRIGEAKRVLIVCPVSLLNDAWYKELKLICPHNTVSVIEGSKQKRINQLALGSTYDIINYDGIETCFDTLINIKYDIIIIDESTAYKNINRRWQFMNKFTKTVPYLWVMTGTPTPQSPEDAYGQVKLVHPDWKMTKSAWKYHVMEKVSEFRWIPKANAKERVLEVMQPAVYVSKKDALPFMPPVTFSFRDVGLSSEQKVLVKELREKRVGFTECGVQINAVHAAALMSKLVQICSGSVYDEFRTVVHVDNTSRDNELLDIVRKARDCEYNDGTANNKVIVFCPFKHTVHRVNAVLLAAGFRSEALTGDCSTATRQAVFGRVQRTVETEVLVAIPDITAHGLTLTAACTTVWYSPITKAELYNQANNRMDRPGQKNPMQIIQLYGMNAEKLMYNNLLSKQDNQREVLSGYSQVVNAIKNKE
jgi:SNF2 family DNA or RNA helicase